MAKTVGSPGYFLVHRDGSLVHVLKVDSEVQIVVSKYLKWIILIISNYSVLLGHQGGRITYDKIQNETGFLLV